jgi:hypothetical protein
MDNFVKPVACTLTTAAAVKQHLEWVDIQGQTITREHISSGVAMTFDLDLADRVESLAAREIECCSFLSLDVRRRSQDVRLEIVSDHPGALPMLQATEGLS